MTCQRCRERPAVSTASGLCEVCLYAEHASPAQVARQVAAADADRERQAAERRRRKEARYGRQ